MAEATEKAQAPQLDKGTFVWTEIGIKQGDAAKCKDFYNKVFGWTFKEPAEDAPMKYYEFFTGGDHSVGGMYEMSVEMFGEHIPPAHFLNYVLVDDVDTNAQKAKELGGTVLREPMDIPNTGRFAIIQDPTGAVIATFKPNMPAK